MTMKTKEERFYQAENKPGKNNKTILRGDFMKIFLESIKEDINKYNFSLVFSVVDNRINVTITDIQEKKPYCGISSRNIDDVEYFLRKNLEKLKKLRDFT